MPKSSSLTLRETIRWQRQIIRHDKWVVRTAKHHKPQVVKWCKAQLLWTTRELHESLGKLHTQQLYPPHHNLWTCISKYEGGVTSVNSKSGHYGMLQMHKNWGYGTSTYASDDSQSVQEWAAEKGWHDNGYPSTTFLWGQWFNYDNAENECLKYA